MPTTTTIMIISSYYGILIILGIVVLGIEYAIKELRT